MSVALRDARAERLDVFPQVNQMPSLCEIESKLRGIINAAQAGRDDKLDVLLDELDELIGAADSSPVANASAQDLARVRGLWKQAALTLASAKVAAGDELRRSAAGRKTLRAYKPY